MTEGPGHIIAAAIRADVEELEAGRSREYYLLRRVCRSCGVDTLPGKMDEDGWCVSCSAASAPTVTPEMLGLWAGTLGGVVALSVGDPSMPVESVYDASRRAARFALDAAGRAA